MEYKHYHIWTTNDTGDSSHFDFMGVYRKDLETASWHYYDTKEGARLHFRKQHMVAVHEDVEDVEDDAD